MDLIPWDYKSFLLFCGNYNLCCIQESSVKSFRENRSRANEVLQSTKSSSKASGENILDDSLSSDSVDEPAAVILPQQNSVADENEEEDEPEACLITNQQSRNQQPNLMKTKQHQKNVPLGKKPTTTSKKDEKQPSIFDALAKKKAVPKSSKLPAKTKINISSDEDSVPKKVATAKAKIPKRKKVVDSDSEDELEPYL
ncbi:transcriptional regulator ATRX homolog [Pristis pectinata]|uniref:transcriptional regulator ATRX homolog n=1 Tax=Pristis pectinata TaxID=685728 RepID=UPI00223CB8CF|nr:transcriptional regulator ATRX homolog [Pristis pectinata]